MNHNLILAVREMLDRHWNVYEIASKLNLDADTVQTIIDIIQGVL